LLLQLAVFEFCLFDDDDDDDDDGDDDEIVK